MYVGHCSKSRKVIEADEEDFTSIVIDGVRTLTVSCRDDKYFSRGVEFFIHHDGYYLPAESISFNKSDLDDSLFFLSFEAFL